MKHLLAIAGLMFAAVAMGDGVPTPAAAPAAPLTPTATPDVLVGKYETARFLIRYTARAEGAARALAGRIEATRDEFVGVLGRDWPGTTEIRIGVGRGEFEAIALPNEKPPSWAAAIAYPDKNIMLLEAISLAEPDGEVNLRHELTHVALGRLGSNWPRWFHEGLAIYLTGEHRYSFSHYATLFRAVKQDRIFHFEDLANSWPDQPTEVEIAYAQSSSFVRFLVDRHGSVAMGELIDGVGKGQPFETAFGQAFHTPVHLEEVAWRQELPARYSWWPIVTGGSTLWIFAAVICVVAYVRRRRAVLAHRAAQEAEEAAHDAAVRILEAEARQRGEVPPQAEGEEEFTRAPESNEDEVTEPPKVKPTLH